MPANSIWTILICIFLGTLMLKSACTKEEIAKPTDYGLLDHLVVIEVVSGSEVPTEFPDNSGEFEYKLNLHPKRGGLASRERLVYLLRPFGGGLSYSSAFKTSLYEWAKEVEANELCVYLEGVKVTSWGTIEGREIGSLSARELIRVLGLLENPNLYSWSRKEGLAWKVNPLDSTFY